MLTCRYGLSLTPEEPPVVIRLHENDDNFTLIFDLYTVSGDATHIQPTGTVKINGTLSDGTSYTKEATMEGTYPATVTVIGDSTMTSVPGMNCFEIQIGNNLAYYTENFYIQVWPSIKDRSMVDSSIREIVPVSVDTGLLNNALVLAQSADERIQTVKEFVEQLESDI